MAKKFNEEEGAQINPTEEQTESVAKDNDAKVTTEPKKVRIRTSEEVDCIIAGKPYKIAKNKEYLVPADVAAILCYAEKAYKL